MTDNRAIGIFDSGVGGLTVFKEIRKIFTHEDIVYFGDTARVPYGPKSKETVIEYSIQNATFLLSKNVKVIVVACNTSSALAIDTLKKQFDVPILGVIEAGAEAAVKRTISGKVGVIGTEGTIKSHAYQMAINSLNSDIIVIEKACPLFVPLVEEGWSDHHITRQVIEIYLADLLAQGIDTLVLGCTHYPIMKGLLAEVCGERITLIDSAETTAEYLQRIVETQYNESDQRNNPSYPLYEGGQSKNSFYVSDNEQKFSDIARNILKIDDFTIEKVNL